MACSVFNLAQSMTLSAVLHQAGHQAEVAARKDTSRQEVLLRNFQPDIRKKMWSNKIYFTGGFL
jgi:hypothetical protein